LLLSGLLALAAPSTAQTTYPTQPIRIVVPFGPGGSVDVVARAVANDWMQQTGHTVVVENRVGAGGNIASASVARGTPDGHLLLLGSNSNSYNDLLYSNAGYEPMRDLVPIVQIGRVPILLVGSATLPARNVADVVMMARSKPTGVNFATFGTGTSGHLLMEMFKRQAQISITHVPYRNGQTYPDLIAGRTDFIFANQFEATPYLRAGQLRAIGVVGDRRLPEFPDVPSFAEQGMKDMRGEVWWGLMAPSGISAPIVARINEMVNKVLASPGFRSRLSALGAQPVGGTAQDFSAFFAAEREKWARVIKDGNIKVE
jgi:tripartite-type tricarboxylate transporter receptor subunit TctC